MVRPHRSREEFWRWNVQNFLRFAGSMLNQNESLLAKFQWSGGMIQSAGPELLVTNVFRKSAVIVGHIFTSIGHEWQVQGEPEHRVHTKLSTTWEGSPYTDVMFRMPVETEGDIEPADYARQLVGKLGAVYAEVRMDLWGRRSIRKCIMTSMLGGESSRWEIWSTK